MAKWAARAILVGLAALTLYVSWISNVALWVGDIHKDNNWALGLIGLLSDIGLFAGVVFGIINWGEAIGRFIARVAQWLWHTAELQPRRDPYT